MKNLKNPDMGNFAQVICDELEENETPLSEWLRILERTIIQEALKRNGQNCTAAAISLNINRTTLVEMRRRHGFTMGEYNKGHWK